MSGATPATTVNRVIEAIPRGQRQGLVADCERVDLVFGSVLCAPDRPMQHVYFPLSGCISLATSVRGHPPLDLALIGSEGMLGLTFALGIGEVVPLVARVKGQGTALRMPPATFRGHVRDSPALLRALQRHLFLLVAQLGRTAACTSFHDVESRLARWLLMSHDRTQGDHVHLTHELLADMLGVQRSAVTIAAGALQKANLISYRRGEIHILDRAGLQASSCGCYEAGVIDAARFFPALRRRRRAAATRVPPPVRPA